MSGPPVVGRALGPLPLVRLGHASRDVLRAVAGDVDLCPAERRDLLALLERLVGPCSLLRVVGLAALREEIHRDHRELHRRAALDEAHGPVVAESAQLLERGDRLLVDRVVVLAAVGHLHHGHSAALVVDKVLLRVLEDFKRQHRGACRKVVCTRHVSFLSFVRTYLHRRQSLSGRRIGRILYSFAPPRARGTGFMV